VKSWTVQVRPSILVWPPVASLVETAEAALWAALDFEASAEEEAAAVVVGFLLQALAELEEALDVAAAAVVAALEEAAAVLEAALVVAAAAVVGAFEVALQALEELEAVGVTRDKAPLVETQWAPPG
jgi:hypothetical protein